MTNRSEVVQPAILALVALGDGVGGTRINASDRATSRKNLENALIAAKERSRIADAARP